MNSVKSTTFRQKVERMYYNYGKFAASHPILMLSGVITVIIISWYPLPNAVVHSSAPYEQRRIKLDQINQPIYDDKRFIGYVQQIVVENLAVIGNHNHNGFIEMTYGALSDCFKIVKIIKTSDQFMDHCYKTKGLNSHLKDESLFPSYKCLLLSPIQLWNESVDSFWADGNVLKTINHRNAFIREMMFGLPWAKTGLRYQYRSDSPQQINYVITFLLQKFDKNLMTRIFDSIKSKYNLTAFEPSDSAEEIVYKDWNYLESHFNLLMTYLVLILYVYFSVRKIEMVKSKLGLAFSACFTVAASLYMSLGICIYIGIVVPTLPGSEIFPYLVVIIGLENTLVVTKSVVATPVDLPVKHRIAQGLEKEGWAITKNLVSEILVFSLGIFTFNPAIQEFFMLALISLSVDFFLQITFFVTVLSIDMRRIELADIRDMQHNQLLSDGNSIDKESIESASQFAKENVYAYFIGWVFDKLKSLINKIINVIFVFNRRNSNKSQTDNRRHKRKASDINTAAFMKSDGMVPVYIPKRLIFLYFWAKSRFFQKLVMITTCAWIVAIILYSLQPTVDNHSQSNKSTLSTVISPWQHLRDLINPKDDDHLSIDWKLAAMHHWPRLANLYSINITGRQLIVLPPQRIINNLLLTKWQNQQPSLIPNRVNSNTSNYRFQWLSSHELLLLRQIPSSLRGWANLGLTVKMVLASIVGVGIVLMSTVLIMTLFQALQTFSGGDDNREPVLRILPLKIDSEFSVPPGITSLTVGKMVMAAGLQIENPDTVVSKVKIWSIENGELCEQKLKSGVWTMLFVDEDRIVVSFSNGCLELWIRCQSEEEKNGYNKLSVEWKEVHTLNLNEGGIVKLKNWEYGNMIVGCSVKGSVIMVKVSENSLHVERINQICYPESIKDFHLSTTTTNKIQHRISIQTQKSIKVASLPDLEVEREVNFDFSNILSSHFAESNLVFALSNQELRLINVDTSKSIKWHHNAHIYWTRCFPAVTRKTKAYKNCHSIFVTFDMEGNICLWCENRKYPFRQIPIMPPSLIYPGPISILPNQDSLVFADFEYLRLFNVRLNKYERSIQILGLCHIDINEILISNESKWLAFLNSKREIFILPMSFVK